MSMTLNDEYRELDLNITSMRTTRRARINDDDKAHRFAPLIGQIRDSLIAILSNETDAARTNTAIEDFMEELRAMNTFSRDITSSVDAVVLALAKLTKRTGDRLTYTQETLAVLIRGLMTRLSAYQLPR
jgi:hypothetical protein